MEGLEPPHLAASDPKSDVSTNFTTSGLRAANVGHLRERIKGLEKRTQLLFKNVKILF